MMLAVCNNSHAAAWDGYTSSSGYYSSAALVRINGIIKIYTQSAWLSAATRLHNHYRSAVPVCHNSSTMDAI